jgi:hypothetical protein
MRMADGRLGVAAAQLRDPEVQQFGAGFGRL